jgi:hypothetical protein
MKYLNEIKKFIGHAKYDEWGGTYIWGFDKPVPDEKSPAEMIAQVKIPVNTEVNKVLSIRGWGAIQNMFPSITDAEQFQDELGKFIADAINEKLQRNENTSNQQ